MSRPPHAVVLRAPASFDPKAVAAVMAGRSTVPAETLVPVARLSWGILGEPSSAEEAEALAAALNAAGIAAVAVPVALIEELPAAILVTKADLSGDGFDVVSRHAGAERERLVWSHLKVLSAGAVTEISHKTVTEGPTIVEKSVRLGMTLATGLPLMGGKSKTRRVAVERPVPFVEMTFASPARRVRIFAAEFDYAALGAKMGYSAELNFPALVSELAARAPGALRGRGARSILEQAPAAQSAYESFCDVEREERWLLALAGLGTALP